MALTSWKAFKFFDESQISQDPSLDAFKDEISCLYAGAENVFLGSPSGRVTVISKAFQVVRSFTAHETGSITHVKQPEGTSLLISIAEDLPHDPTLKVWALDKVEKKSGVPRCLSTLTVHNGRKPFPTTTFACLDDLSQLAVGFANGAVTIIRGDLVHDRGAKQRTVFESEEPITGIQFREGQTTALYIATTARILTLIISGKGQGQPARVLEENGCALGCMTVDQATKDVIVARDDAIYYYGLHGRGSCYSCDGKKQSLHTHKDYITLLVSSSTSSIAKSTLGAFGVNPTSDSYQASTILILNPDFHYLAYIGRLSKIVKSCFSAWGDFFVLTLDGQLYRYHEKTLQQKFDILYERNLYILAIQMAQKEGLDAAQQSSIFRRYGDFLYQKRDYDTAMQQYLRAIDNTEPSQIIRKFLDTQRIHNLIDYLEELHEHNRATADHTILLLNCYAKLQDVDKLESFIKAPGDLKFDLDIAISMCRQGGYFDQAAFLARKHSEHDLVVSILIEDSKRYGEALAYIWRLDAASAYPNLSKYGTVLLEHCPTDTTQIFVDYYTGRFRPKKDVVIVTPVAESQHNTNFAVSAVQNLASLLPLPYMSANANDKIGGPDQNTLTKVVENTTDDEPASKYDVPKPRGAFSAFVDHPDEFIKFLEACIDANALSDSDRTDVYTTLFEMYLHNASGSQGKDKAEWETKAKELVESKIIKIDPSNVLLLSHLEHYQDGTILMREQQGLRLDIFRSYTSANDTAGAIKALHKYGPDEPQLYPAALAYFCSNPQVLEEARDELDRVLRKIDEEGLMAPLQVIQTLSSNDVANIGTVRRYLQDSIGREREEIAKNRRMISIFKNDTAAKRQELEKLTSEPQTFNASRCSSCGYALDQPTVHFMCQHSFHQRCLNTMDGQSVEDVECPQCAPQNATIRAIKKAQDESRDRQDLFRDALARSRDGFTTVAEWFGRGVMSTS